MRALTLMQPWASAVFVWKDVENRKTLLPPAELLTEPRPFFAVHAGLGYGLLGYRFPLGCRETPREECTRGAVLGIARVVGALDMRNPLAPRIIGQLPLDLRYRELGDLHTRAAYLGPIGWLLEDRIPIVPHACTGALGCWTLKKADEDLIVTRARDIVRARGDARLEELVDAQQRRGPIHAIDCDMGVDCTCGALE